MLNWFESTMYSSISMYCSVTVWCDNQGFCYQVRFCRSDAFRAWLPSVKSVFSARLRLTRPIQLKLFLIMRDWWEGKVWQSLTYDLTPTSRCCLYRITFWLLLKDQETQVISLECVNSILFVAVLFYRNSCLAGCDYHGQVFQHAS